MNKEPTYLGSVSAVAGSSLTVAGDGGSMMTTCASTSSVTMAFLAVAAAVLALSF